MFSKNYFLLFVLIGALFTTACTEEESLFVPPADYTPSVFIQQPVVFQFVYTNPAQQIRHGWIVDRYGNAKRYDLSALNTSELQNLPEGNICSENEINRLRNLTGDVLTTIDRQELADKSKLIKNAANGNLTETHTHLASGGTATLFAYLLDHTEVNTDNSSSGCDNSSDCSVDYYKRVLLEQTGATEIYNNNPAAADLIGWLKATVNEEYWK